MANFLDYYIQGNKTYITSRGKFRTYDLVYLKKQQRTNLEIKKHYSNSSAWSNKKTKLYLVQSKDNKINRYFKSTDLAPINRYTLLNRNGIKNFRVGDVFAINSSHYYISGVNNFGNYINFSPIENDKTGNYIYILKSQFDLTKYIPLGLVYDPHYDYYSKEYRCHYDYSSINNKKKSNNMILVEYNTETLSIINSLEELEENTELKIIDKNMNKDKLDILKKLIELNWIDRIDNLKE